MLLALAVALLTSAPLPLTAGGAAQQQGPVTIVARDFTLEVPDHLAGPFVHIRLENAGREPHYMRFLRIDGERGLEDFAAWRKEGGPMPPWLRPAGGIGTIAPGERAEFRAVFLPGRYIVMCGHPSPDGRPHVDKGMYRIVTVDPEGSGHSRLADATIWLNDRSLTIYGSPHGGTYVFLVYNEGPSTHQALIVRLPKGVTAQQELDWFRGGSKGRRPGHPIGGVIELAPDQEARVFVNLEPGRYVVFCAIPVDGQRSFDRGVVAEFEIGG